MRHKAFFKWDWAQGKAKIRPVTLKMLWAPPVSKRKAPQAPGDKPSPAEESECLGGRPSRPKECRCNMNAAIPRQPCQAALTDEQNCANQNKSDRLYSVYIQC